MSTKRQFGVSSRLYQAFRLGREHLLDIGGHGFEVVEVLATPTHFDAHNPAAIGDLQQWLAEAGLTLDAVHAPVSASFEAGRPAGVLSLASPEPEAREQALNEALAALHIARRIPFRCLVVQLGIPRSRESGPGANSRDAARRSVEALQEAAVPLQVGIAIEIVANELSSAGTLVHFVEEVLESPAGICVDTGHAHLQGDVVEAIETVAEHLNAAHLHDNRGRADDHLLPFEGTIDWPSALTGLLKVGYEGPLLIEPASQPSAAAARAALGRARQVRQRIERLLAD